MVISLFIDAIVLLPGQPRTVHMMPKKLRIIKNDRGYLGAYSCQTPKNERKW
jgi:hypothetical protein